LRRVAGGSAKANELLAEAERLDAATAWMSPDAYDAISSKALHYDSYRTRRKRDR